MFLRNELEAAGFNLTDDELRSRYMLLFETGQETSQITSALVIPTTQTTSGNVGGEYYSGQTTGTTTIPYSESYTVQKIWLELYTTSDVAEGKLMTIWEGYIGAGAEEYKKYSKEIVRLLLDVYGTNYEAHTPIPTN